MVAVMQQDASKTYDPIRIYRLSAEAGADPRTVRRYLEGKTVKTMSAARISRAIERLEGASSFETASSDEVGAYA